MQIVYSQYKYAGRSTDQLKQPPALSKLRDFQAVQLPAALADQIRGVVRHQLTNRTAARDSPPATKDGAVEEHGTAIDGKMQSICGDMDGLRGGPSGGWPMSMSMDVSTKTIG
ncbi:hypothetical protein CFAM422_007924 [Trichoderma lentiforme]|uniref:Uncharacterized protein n=1 Tax=Trichoderma lentiforme TaxID=1567552 RepID=A0A9P4XC04_9HYPO|nr:hypothetical protein CFAM422_007924 [Trichoderma lentiforme]